MKANQRKVPWIGLVVPHTLRLAFGNVMPEWDAGATYLSYRWCSKQMMTQGATNFACARMVFEGYPWPQRASHGVTVLHMADGRCGLERLVRHAQPYRLPSGRRAREHTIEIQGIETVREIHLVTSVAALDT